jgi:hypothetical protein
LVGVVGFEPTVSCSQSTCDNQASLHPAQGMIKRRRGLADTSPLRALAEFSAGGDELLAGVGDLRWGPTEARK